MRRWKITAKKNIGILIWSCSEWSWKHCCSTNADEDIKYFQVNLWGHAGQRPGSYILLKSFKGLFVRAAMTRHTENNFSVCQKKKGCAAKTPSFIHLGQWAQKSNVCPRGGIDSWSDKMRHKTGSAWVGRFQAQPRRNNNTRGTRPYIVTRLHSSDHSKRFGVGLQKGGGGWKSTLSTTAKCFFLATEF